MLFVLVPASIGLISFFLIAYVRYVPKSGEKAGRFSRWILPAGIVLETWVRRLDKGGKRAGTEEIRQLLCSLNGREEGEKKYFLYRAKRWGWALAGGTLVLCAFTITQLLSLGEDLALERQILRPLYGEGDRSARVQMEVVGEEGAAREFYLRVPEQDISSDQAEKGLKEAEQILLNTYNEKITGEDVNFIKTIPTSEGNVSVIYRTLTPELIRSGGALNAPVGEEIREAKIRATLSLFSYQTETILTIFLAAEKDKSVQGSMEDLISRIEEGAYTEETMMTLPDRTENGEEIRWSYAKEDNRFLWTLLFVLIPALALAKQDTDYKELSEKRSVEIRRSYPEFLGELAILMGAGASLSGAWIRLAKDYHRQKERTGKQSMLLEEVEKAGREMEEGVSIRDALIHFAERVPIPEIRRFSALLTQNLRRGDGYLLTRLREMSDEAWESRKKLARERSEEVDTKLMLPLMLLLVVVLIIVLSPALISMKF